MLTRKSRAWIALGGNQGNVLSCFQSARTKIAKHPKCEVSQSSLLYQTPPLGSSKQQDYLNAIIAIHTYLKPLMLLQFLQTIEHQHGRIRQEHWGPRTLDLDIIAYNSIHLQSETLNLPHNQMQVRQFVLRPLCDIDPQWRHPTIGKSASQLLQSLLDSGEKPLESGCLW